MVSGGCRARFSFCSKQPCIYVLRVADYSQVRKVDGVGAHGARQLGRGFWLIRSRIVQDFVWILNGKGACSQRAFSDGRFILSFWFLGVSGLRYARSGSGSITQEWCRINPVEEAGKETWPDLTPFAFGRA